MTLNVSCSKAYWTAIPRTITSQAISVDAIDNSSLLPPPAWAKCVKRTHAPSNTASNVGPPGLSSSLLRSTASNSLNNSVRKFDSGHPRL
ncbi:hypothetical protein FRB94_000722 [Tulasnella sp. JGI-2019a]|nr:hypothetical protein FRB94_000722 [Tulasnella sp. JGI-2019a]KAG9025866.1 hypothetical protein FRB95_009663 [Tulasnella sp. JGI-2019a]